MIACVIAMACSAVRGISCAPNHPALLPLTQTIAVLGGLAYGYNSCGNILSCFENPAWLIIATNT